MSAKATMIGAIAWAASFLLSAVVLKGDPIGDWIEAVSWPYGSASSRCLVRPPGE